MLASLKRLYPVRELARILDLHFEKMERLLVRLDDIDRLSREGRDLAYETGQAIQRAHAQAQRENAALLRGLTASVEQVERLLREQAALTVRAEGFDFENPDVALLEHLRSSLAHGVALDIGANIGEVSERLLEAGYEVYAFEPHPVTFEKLTARLGGRPGFRAMEAAIGPADGRMDLHLASTLTPNHSRGSADHFHSLVPHPMPE